MPPNEVHHSYDDGVRDGRLLALENTQAKHSERFDKVEGRLSTLERVAYALLGIIGVLQFIPIVHSIFEIFQGN